jgi:hypothetical protein
MNQDWVCIFNFDKIICIPAYINAFLMLCFFSYYESMFVCKYIIMYESIRFGNGCL